MKVTRIQAYKFTLQAFLGFILWSILLTPYTILVLKVTLWQYLAWLLMEATIVPPCAIIVVNLTNRATDWALRKRIKRLVRWRR